MTEDLLNIVTDIDKCSKARKGSYIYPIARVHCNYDGEQKSFWFTNRSVTPREIGSLKNFGTFVHKYSDVAIRMMKINVGSSFDYSTKNYIKRMVDHEVVVENRTDFNNQTIEIAGDSLVYQYRSISTFLSALRQNKEDIADTKENIAQLLELKKDRTLTPQKRGQITKSIKEYQKKYRILTKQQEDLKNITIYIRKQGEMRYSPIVDPIQTRIMSQDLFDGKTIIIDGGPGTGKTTTMIHRLAYLTSKFAINEDEKKKIGRFNLKPLQRKQLLDDIDNQKDWIFFSPSPMLRDYLAEAMKQENLTNINDKVWDWKTYCRSMLKDYYGLLGDEGDGAPFRICYESEPLFKPDFDIINEFVNFYLGQLRNIKSVLPQFDPHGPVHSWTAIIKGISKKLDGCENLNIAQYISLFNSLESVYGDDCKQLLRDRAQSILRFASVICDLINQNEEAKSDMEDIVDLSSDDNDSPQYDDDEIPGVDTAESGTASERLNSGQKKLQKVIENWLKHYCYKKVNGSIRLSNKEVLMNSMLLPLLGDKYTDEIQKIGELMIFEQYAKYTRGVKAIILNRVPSVYKDFRSYLLNSQYAGCDLRLLRNLIKNKRGKELHYQEQSLLLGFINTLVKKIKGVMPGGISHPYVEAYDELSRPIIGIDEATDFCSCDIYAMQSLLSRDFYSLTLCGDMMQRLTSYGITSWKELDNVVPNPVVVEMKTSYRQSKKLLEVARQIYSDTMGKTPNYHAFMKSNKVPAPLVYINETEFEKNGWIAKRISEVYKAYSERLPSIAIFVNDKGYIPKFIDNLEKTDFFKEKNIKVFDGTKNDSNSSENHICVYPIDVVKGMEFDVVFFHNIDNSSVNVDLLKRYIYVGVSRAAFFLGITLSEDNKEITKYFERNKDWFNI